MALTYFNAIIVGGDQIRVSGGVHDGQSIQTFQNAFVGDSYLAVDGSGHTTDKNVNVDFFDSDADLNIVAIDMSGFSGSFVFNVKNMDASSQVLFSNVVSVSEVGDPTVYGNDWTDHNGADFGERTFAMSNVADWEITYLDRNGLLQTVRVSSDANVASPDTFFVDFVCFAAGTRIDTPRGPRPVEDLRPGDLVSTLDHGPQRVLWTRIDTQPLEGAEAGALPVIFEAGAFGPGCPARALVVSPQHRMLIGGRGQADGLRPEALAPAKALASLPGVRRATGWRQATWVHFACARHEIVRAEGCWTESLLIGAMVQNGLTRRERAQLAALYGPRRDAALNGPAARPCLSVGDTARRIAGRVAPAG